MGGEWRAAVSPKGIGSIVPGGKSGLAAQIIKNMDLIGIARIQMAIVFDFILTTG
jgi:hypothetical protein